MCWLPQAPKQQFNGPWTQTFKSVSQNKVFTFKNILSEAFTIVTGCWLPQKSTVFSINEEPSICRAPVMCWTLDKVLCIYLFPSSSHRIPTLETISSMYDSQSSRCLDSISDGSRQQCVALQRNKQPSGLTKRSLSCLVWQLVTLHCFFRSVPGWVPAESFFFLQMASKPPVPPAWFLQKSPWLCLTKK